jgi:glycosyltransferase involved in cell wall biosynthesis
MLLPWLTRGGADIEALNYLQVLGEHQVPCVVVTTVAHDNPWRSRLPAHCEHIDLGGARTRDLSALLRRLQPRAIHNINSKLGFAVMQQARWECRLYTTHFCAEISRLGRSIGYAYRYLPRLFSRLSAVSFDNQRFRDSLAARFGFDRAKLHVHYQPVVPVPVPVPRRTPTGNLLWAGRLDRQKRPDILMAIARAMAADPVHFHVYGAPQIDRARRGRTPTNVTLHGAYDGFAALPHGRFDALVYTAQWDGLPNVLLEAMAAGIPVIAPDVGGIAEVVQDGVTGVLISRFDDVLAYVRAIRARTDTSVEPARALLCRQHTAAGFRAALAQFAGYLPLSSAASER